MHDANLQTPLVVGHDASEHTIAATLNQGGQLVAFYLRAFSKIETRYPTVKEEAAAIIEAVRKWSHLLYGHKFTLITDQRAVSFMLDPERLGKIKSAKFNFGKLNWEIWNMTLFIDLVKAI